MFQHRLETVNQPLFDDATFELAEWTSQSVRPRTIFINQVRSRTRHVYKRGQRQRRRKVMIRVDLVRGDQHLWAMFAVDFVRPDVIDYEHRLESEFDLGPD